MVRENKYYSILSFIFMLVFVFHLMIADASEVKSLPGKIEKTESSLYYDHFNRGICEEFFQYLYLDKMYHKISGIASPALNVNSFDEIPDSDWFINRHGRKRMTKEELTRGVNENNGPLKPFVVTKGKAVGYSFGFFIKDARGEKYLLKFDSPDYFEMTTSPEIVSSKFFHAIGYYVPQYTIFRFGPDNFEVAEGAKFYDTDGFLKKLTKKKMLQLLQDNVYLPPGGEYRASASKFLKGDILGPVGFDKRRKGDPEDLIVHHGRREIRALRVFSSWLNHRDIVDRNSLAVARFENGNYKVKHYFIDFGSTLGSGARMAKPPETGHEYWLDLKQIEIRFTGLGFYQTPWYKTEKIVYPSVGRFGSDLFEPKNWKQMLPQFAFDSLTNSDAFWAAKIIMRFSDADIRTIVNTGEYSNPEAENFIVKTLIKRRDKIGKYWFSQVNPLDSFELTQTRKGNYILSFDDLLVKYNFTDKNDTVYRYRIEGFVESKDKKKIKWEKVTDYKKIKNLSSVELCRDNFMRYSTVKIALQTKREKKNWSKKAWVVLGFNPSKDYYQIIGIEREN